MRTIGLSTHLLTRRFPIAVYTRSVLPSQRGLVLAPFRHRIRQLSTDTNIKMAPSAVAGEPVTIGGRQYRAVREGLAQILAPYRKTATTSKDAQKPAKKPHNNDEGDQAVFYNPIQQYNRDLSVLAILTYGESALAEKTAKRKERVKRDRRGRKKNKGGKAAASGTAAIGEENEKKRKADVLDDEGQIGGVEKKTRSGQLDEDIDDDDEGIEVRQLGTDTAATTVENEAGSTLEPIAQKEPPADTDQPPANPVQFTILDALSASGLRAIRYAKEIPFATNIVANDLSPEAVKSIELNVDHNEVRGKVHSNVGDARAYMYSKVGNEHQNPPAGYVHKFDVIDLDPYGTAAPFLDAALQALADGGLLCVTCTDAGVFASNGYPEKAYSLYNGVTMKGPFSHEAGLRLILHGIATSAARYSIAIEPLLSLSIDFYARVFVRIHKQQQQVKLLAGTTMVTYTCDSGCGAWTTQPIARNQERQDRLGTMFYKHGYAQAPLAAPLCEHCGSKTHLGGPMWAGPLHNPYFIQKILDKLPEVDTTTYHTTERVRGMLTLALEEDLTLATSDVSTESTETVTGDSSADPKFIPRLPPQLIDQTPFFVVPNTLSKVLHCATPREDQLRGAIRYLGYKVTRSHCKPGSLKTNIPWDVLWEVMREWVRQHAPVKEGSVTKGMPGFKIMQRIRGTDTRPIWEVQEKIRRALELGVDGREELRSLLESGLYRLEHPKVDDVETGDGKADKSDEAGQAIQNAPLTDTNGDLKQAMRNEPRDFSKLKVVFDSELGKEKPRGKLVRYQTNPRANWGPMSRAG